MGLSSKRVAILETAMTAFLWGTSFPVIRFGIAQGIEPVLFAFLRFTLAAPIMVIVASIRGRGLIKKITDRSIWLLGILNAIGFVSQFIGQAYTDASISALLVNLSVIIAAIGGSIFLGERFNKWKIYGVLMAVIGVLFVTTKGDVALLSRGELVGDILCLITATTWGTYVIYSKMKTDNIDWDPISVTTGIVIITALFLSPVLFFSRPKINLELFLVVVYTAIMNTVIPFILYQSALMHLTASSSSIILMLEILTAMIISNLFLGERFTLYSLFGASLILISILIVSKMELVRDQNLERWGRKGHGPE